MISVIIPFKNSALWLPRCADSLRDNPGEFEFIFVNDHSTDDGPDIIASYTDQRFVLVNNKRKRGVSGARNTGLDIARGKWITFLDADDAMLPDAAKKFNLLLRVPAQMHQANHSRFYHRTHKTVTKYTNPERFFYPEMLSQCKCWCIVWNKLIKADLVKDIRFNETMQYGEDELFVLECLAKCGKIHHGSVATTLHCFENENSLVKVKTAEDLWRQVRALEKFIKTNNDASMRKAVCGVLSEHFGSKIFRDIIGE